MWAGKKFIIVRGMDFPVIACTLLADGICQDFIL